MHELEDHLNTDVLSNGGGRLGQRRERDAVRRRLVAAAVYQIQATGRMITSVGHGALQVDFSWAETRAEVTLGWGEKERGPSHHRRSRVSSR